MKRILSIFCLAIIVAIGSISIDAQSKKSKSSAKSSSSTSITVSKNEYGYPDPSGHTYKWKDSEGTLSFTFMRNGDLKIVATPKRGKAESATTEWDQDDDIISLIWNGDIMEQRISSDGRTLTSLSTGLKMTIVK